MLTASACPWRNLPWLLLALTAGLITGCLPGVSWLPDSSGFVYTEGHHFQQLCIYDLAKGEKRTLIADTQAATMWPALSPDGKQIALARGQKAADGSQVLQVIIYDITGKDVHRSQELAWRPADPDRGGSEAAITGAHWSRDGKKLVVHDYHDKRPRSAIYDPATHKFQPLEGTPCIVGNTPALPDGKGFLVSRPRGEDSMEIVAVDWDGKERPLALEPEVLDDRDKRVLLVYPIFGSSRWDGPSAVITFGSWRFTLNTAKQLGTFARVPDAEAVIGGRHVTQQHQFASGASARVLKADDPGDNTGEKYRLEVLRPNDKEPQVILEKTDGMYLFAPSPDGKHLAIRFTTGREENKQRIIVVDDKGQIERTVEVEQ